MGGRADGQRENILRWIRLHGGATTDQIQQEFKLRRYVIRGRLSELKSKGLVYKDFDDTTWLAMPV